MCPEPAKSLALPADDRVGLDVHQGRAPTLPQPGESDPEQSVEGSQNGSSPLSLEGRELKAKSGILRRHGRMTAEEESRKPKQEQGEGRHRPRFLGHMLMRVKPYRRTEYWRTTAFRKASNWPMAIYWCV